MNVSLMIKTVRYLKPKQVFYQVKYRLLKPKYEALKSPSFEAPTLKTTPIAKCRCVDGDSFTFLNLEHLFAGWNFIENGMLWAYNQNYFDWINQDGVSKEECCKWVDKFIEDLPSNKVGLDPYPIALRSINWVKFFCQYPCCATKQRVDSLYSQLKLLDKKLEYHLLGNHLLEDAYALYIGGSCFRDDALLKKASKLLKGQLDEQILPDGAHYEQSPMYHCILLDRLLDCININYSEELVNYAVRMLGHLCRITWQDGSIPLLNDSANGIAPTPKQIIDYANRLGLKWKTIPLKESGYRKLCNELYEAILDVGGITATYQPGHTHADTFNYELRINGKPVVVDTGISTYNKTERRQYERGTEAHNTVFINGKNSSEVWGGFRVGRRAKVTVLQERDKCILAQHDGYGRNAIVKRHFTLGEEGFKIEDLVPSGIEAISYVHLSPNAKYMETVNNEVMFDTFSIKVDNAVDLSVLPVQVSEEYNMFRETSVLRLVFKDYLKYTISAREI